MNDRDLVDRLRRLDRDTIVPPPSPEREAALLAVLHAGQRVGSHNARAGLAPRVARWLAAAVVLAAIGTTAWFARPHTGGEPIGPRRAGSTPPAAADPAPPAEFVTWPDAAGLPALESGQLVRMDLPASVLPALGLFPPASGADVVRADVLVGQDGFARAVRLLP